MIRTDQHGGNPLTTVEGLSRKIETALVEFDKIRVDLRKLLFKDG